MRLLPASNAAADVSTCPQPISDRFRTAKRPFCAVYTKTMRGFTGICVFLLCSLVGVFAQESPATAQPGLTIRVVEGDGAINSIRLKRGHDPVVQVLDPTGEPLANATVTFLLPAMGPGGEFQGSVLSYTVQTDSRGIARGNGLVPNRTAGDFRIRVVASSGGLSASANVRQTNTEPVVEASHTRKYVILGVIAAGVAGAAIAATRGSSSSPSATTGSVTGSLGAAVVAGTPSLGPPH